MATAAPQLEQVLQSELDPSWLVSAVDRSSRRAKHAADRLAEAWRVGEIERLEAELHRVPLPWHLEALAKHEVNAIAAGAAKHISAVVAVHTRGAHHEC